MKRKLFARMMAISFAFTNVNSFVFAEEGTEEPAATEEISEEESIKTETPEQTGTTEEAGQEEETDGETIPEPEGESAGETSETTQEQTEEMTEEPGSDEATEVEEIVEEQKETEIEYQAESGDFTYSIEDLGLEITGYTGKNSSVIIPSNIDGYKVASIGRYAFENNENINSVTIPYGVIYIGDSAFANCWNLTNVSIPDSVTSIDKDAFYNCSNLESISFPESIEFFVGCNLCECRNLSTVFFYGDFPKLKPDEFSGVGDLTVYYPSWNKTWTSDKLHNYGASNIVWEKMTNPITSSAFSAEKDGWPIGNVARSFYDGDWERIPFNTYVDAYLAGSFPYLLDSVPSVISFISSQSARCFGMSLLAAMDYCGKTDISSITDKHGSGLSEYGYDSIYSNDAGEYYSIRDNKSLLKLLHRAHVSQLSHEFYDTEIWENDTDYSNLLEYIESGNDNPIMIGLESGNFGHSVLVDTSKGVITSEDGSKYDKIISLYDPNVPSGGENLNNPAPMYNRAAYLFLDTRSGDWSYNVYENDEVIFTESDTYLVFLHRNIKFFDICSLASNYLSTRLSLNSHRALFKQFDVIFYNNEIEILKQENGEITYLADGYDYSSMYDGEDVVKFIDYKDNGLSYTTDEGEVLIQSPTGELLSVSNKGQIIVNIDNDNTVTIEANNDAAINVESVTENNYLIANADLVDGNSIEFQFSDDMVCVNTSTDTEVGFGDGAQNTSVKNINGQETMAIDELFAEEPQCKKHELIKTEAIIADSEKEGNTEYWTCERCGKYFADENGNEEIEKDSWIIPKLAKPENISIDQGPYSEIPTDAFRTFTATVSPKGCDDRIIWSSSNPKVAGFITDGVLAGRTYGKTIITATSLADPSIKATCVVQVWFEDVLDASQSYYKPVYWGADNDVVAGFNGGQYFGPDEVCTRAQFVTFLWRLAGRPTGDKNVAFKDISNSESYYRAIKWAVSKGIIVGYKDDNTFRPDNEVTRGQVATMLWRFAGKKTPTLPKTSPFSDIDASNSSYRAVVWGQQAGVIKGYKDGTFQPDTSCLRQHIVTFLYRYARDVMKKKV